jgi:hypothetical protein
MADGRWPTLYYRISYFVIRTLNPAIRHRLTAIDTKQTTFAHLRLSQYFCHSNKNSKE